MARRHAATAARRTRGDRSITPHRARAPRPDPEMLRLPRQWFVHELYKELRKKTRGPLSKMRRRQAVVRVRLPREAFEELMAPVKEGEIQGFSRDEDGRVQRTKKTSAALNPIVDSAAATTPIPSSASSSSASASPRPAPPLQRQQLARRRLQAKARRRRPGSGNGKKKRAKEAGAAKAHRPPAVLAAVRASASRRPRAREAQRATSLSDLVPPPSSKREGGERNGERERERERESEREREGRKK